MDPSSQIVPLFTLSLFLVSSFKMKKILGSHVLKDPPVITHSLLIATQLLPEPSSLL